MENMNNAAEMIEAGAANAATGTTFAQKLGKATVVAIVAAIVVKTTIWVTGKVKAKKAKKQNQDVIVTVDSEDETK